MQYTLLKEKYAKLKLSVFFSLLIFIPCVTFAQVFLYISPNDLAEQSNSYGAGTIIPAEIILDTHGATIGVGEGKISFSSENLEIIEIFDDNSIFDLWIHSPSLFGSEISFAGSIQDGFSGKGKVFDVKLRAKNNLTGFLSFEDVRVLTFTSQSQNILQGTQGAWYPFELPTVIPREFNFDKDREQGSRYLDVAYLQLCLISEQVYSKEVNGFFDFETQEAVIGFQEKYFDEILAPQMLQNGAGLLDEHTRRKLNQVCPREIPEQLFDISFGLESLAVLEISELEAVIIFESFGSVPTPVNLTFIIFDEAGSEIYREMESIIVETENVIRKEFPDLVLSSGQYTFVLQTLYDVDVFDEFEEDFEVGVEVGEGSASARTWPWILFVLASVIFIIFIVWAWSKRESVGR